MARVNPEISVLTACYNWNEQYLKDAYDALAKDNDDVAWQWIIQVDGEDTSPLPGLLREDKRVSIAYNEVRLGAGGTRNYALTRAEAPCVQNLDADDWLLPGSLRALSKALIQHTGAVLSFGRDVKLEEDGSRDGYKGGLKPGIILPGTIYERWKTLPFPPLHPAGIMWRREALLAYGAWAALPAGEDTSVLIAATMHHPAIFVDTDSFIYRRHDSQISYTPTFEAARTYKRAFIEQRAQAVVAHGPMWTGA